MRYVIGVARVEKLRQVLPKTPRQLLKDILAEQKATTTEGDGTTS